MTNIYGFKKKDCEYLRHQAKQRFDKIRSTWVDACKWALPHRNRWLLSQTEGERNNQHIVDSTHVLALRSYVAGFLEGNTSATRPWYRIGTGDADKNLKSDNHLWLDTFTRRTLMTLSSSNFYHSAGFLYYDYGTVNTAAQYIEELPDGTLFFHNLIPGSYYVINDSYGEAIVLVREFSLTVKALVERYGRERNGSAKWDNISSAVKKMYTDGNYTQLIDIVEIVQQNTEFNPDEPQGLENREWMSKVYELGGEGGPQYQDHQSSFGATGPDIEEAERFLEIRGARRKPFIIARSTTEFEYGEKGPTTDALGIIKSLNKKAIAKDQALEHILKPAMQGPANLRKSYITTQPNSFIPLDATSLSQKGLRPVFELNPAINDLVGDVQDLRQQVNQHYYADFLLYLSKNPKTRTATETEAVVNEQQLVIGPNLQSLNWSYNLPLIDYVMSYVLDEDPLLPPPPEDLEGQFLRPEFISVFAQAQRAADLPAIDRYIGMVTQVGAIDPRILDKANLDKLADLYEDRLYLPAGLNNPQEKVEAIRQQQQAQAQRQQEIEQTAQMAGAAKDLGLKANQEGEPV